MDRYVVVPLEQSNSGSYDGELAAIQIIGGVRIHQGPLEITTAHEIVAELNALWGQRRG